MLEYANKITLKGDNIMKFAVITDIHGNFDALQTVLDDIDSRDDIEKIYNLGDNIGIGHETNKVLDTIFDRDDMEMIAGNVSYTHLTLPTKSIVKISVVPEK